MVISRDERHIILKPIDVKFDKLNTPNSELQIKDFEITNEQIRNAFSIEYDAGDGFRRLFKSRSVFHGRGVVNGLVKKIIVVEV